MLRKSAVPGRAYGPAYILNAKLHIKRISPTPVRSTSKRSFNSQIKNK